MGTQWQEADVRAMAEEAARGTIYAVHGVLYESHLGRWSVRFRERDRRMFKVVSFHDFVPRDYALTLARCATEGPPWFGHYKPGDVPPEWHGWGKPAKGQCLIVTAIDLDSGALVLTADKKTYSVDIGDAAKLEADIPLIEVGQQFVATRHFLARREGRLAWRFAASPAGGPWEMEP